jgi:hypothetical protein
MVMVDAQTVKGMLGPADVVADSERRRRLRVLRQQDLSYELMRR